MSVKATTAPLADAPNMTVFPTPISEPIFDTSPNNWKKNLFKKIFECYYIVRSYTSLQLQNTLLNSLKKRDKN